MAKLTYTNLPLDYPALIGMMKSRGLSFNHEDDALELLKKLGYFRIASCLRPMESDKQTHVYKSGSTFDNAINLYFFDNELRSIIFSVIQNIEIAIRAKIIHNVSMKFGPFWFADQNNFSNIIIFNKNLTHTRGTITFKGRFYTRPFQ